MVLCDETIIFILFVGLGFIFSIIFDFFRAIRKLKKVKTRVVYFQDILYFLIIGIVLLITVLNIQRNSFRLYLIVAIVLGIIIYISMIGNKIMNLFCGVLKISNAFWDFIFMPFKLYLTFFDKQITKIKKYAKWCCKKISYMINFYHKKLDLVVAKSKNRSKTKERRWKNDKSWNAKK